MCVCVCVCVSCSVVPNSLWLHGLCLPGPSVHGILQARKLEWAASPFSRGSSWFRDRNCSPALQADSLPSELPGSPQLTPWGALTGILSTNSCGPTNTAGDPTLRQRISRVEPPSYTSVFYAWEAATSYGSGYQGEKGEVYQLKELAKFLFKWEISSGFQYLRKTLSFV